MIKNGDFVKSEWCHLVRNWYNAIDEAGVDASQRIEWLLAIRQKLLPFLRVGHFPPPGLYVASLPMAQFEGFLGNVDRRLQLYSMTKNKSYNRRAVTSLDSETFFSGFQDYDPKGSGVLRPDDIPTAIGVAVCLFSQRLSTERNFYMKTTKKTRVYPEHNLHQKKSESESSDESGDARRANTHVIHAKNHFFDIQERKTTHPRRKSGVISRFGVPGKGAEGARLYHKTNEEKILSHRRYGLTDEDLDLS